MFGGIPRILYICSTRWRELAIAGVVLIAISSGIAVTADVPTEERTIPPEEQVALMQSHSAVVQPSARLHEPGTRLVEQALYSTGETPTVRIEQSVSGVETETEVVITTQTVYRVSYTDEPLYTEVGRSNTSTGTVSDSQTVEVSITKNMTTARSRLKGLTGVYGGSAKGQMLIVTTVNKAGSGGEKLLQHETPIAFTTGGYIVPTKTSTISVGESKTVTEPVDEKTETVAGVRVSHTQIGAGIGGFAGLLVLFASVYGRRILANEEQRLRRRMIDNRFSELVVRMADGQCPNPDRVVQSMQDLAFISEDAVEPVLHFPDEDCYIVQTEGVVYAYSFSVGGGDNPTETDDTEVNVQPDSAQVSDVVSDDSGEKDRWEGDSEENEQQSSDDDDKK